MKISRLSLVSAILFAVMGLLSGALMSIDRVTQASDGPTTDILPADSPHDWVVVRLYYDDPKHLAAVSAELDIWEVNQADHYAVVALPPAQYHWLEVSGYRLEIDAEKTALIQAPNAPLDPRFHYFDEDYTNPNGLYITGTLQDINANYPGLTELIDIGDAWQAGQPGEHDRDMWVLRITNEDPTFGDIADKPTFFLFATIHAREVAIPELAIRYIKYLTGGYNGEGGYSLDADVTWLVDHNVVYVLVIQNPDGHRVNEENTSAYRRKNMDNDDGCGDPSSWGVDLNRNHSFFWGCCGGSSGNPCSETYRGPLRGSEPETQAFQDYFATVIPDQNGPNGDDEYPPASPITTTGIFISLHSYSDLVLWPWDLPQPPPNEAELETIGRKLAYLTTYVPGSVGYPVDGSTDDWTYGKFGIPSYVFEVGPSGGSCGGFFPAYDCIDGTGGYPQNFWAENKPAFLFAHKIARTPYMTAYGPDAQNLYVTPTPVYAGTPVDLTAIIADHRYGGDPLQPISAAEYFIDVPGEDGTGIPMSPTDGNWGGLSEDVEAIVDTTGLALGQHYILVHGLNDDGDWGPFTAVFVDILTDYGVSLEPDHASAIADPGQTVTYTLQVNNIGINTDTYTVTVDSLWPVEAPSIVGPIDPAQSAGIDILVTIPLTATSGESDLATVTVTSQNAGEVSDSAILTTTARYYDLLLAPESAEGTGYPGMTVTYTLQLTNTGNTTDTYDLLATAVWTTTAPASLGPLSAGESVALDVTVVVPISALPGDSDIASLTATSQADGTKSQSATLTTIALRRGPTLIPVEASTAADPGDQVTYVISVTNSGDLLEAFDVSLLGASWETVAPTSTGQLAPGQTTTLLVTVTVPLDASGGASDTATLMVTSPSPGTQPAFATLTTTANNIYALELTTDHDAQGAPPGRTASYTLQLTNLGNITDTFDVLISSTWSAEIVLPIGPVAAGDSLLITVNVHIPADALLGEFDITTVTATSQGDPLEVSLLQLTTTAEGYKVFLPVTSRN